MTLSLSNRPRGKPGRLHRARTPPSGALPIPPERGSALSAPPTLEFTDDRPCAKAFDARRIRIPDRSRDYLARPQDTGAASGEADHPWLRHRDGQRPDRYRRRSDPDHRKRMTTGILTAGGHASDPIERRAGPADRTVNIPNLSIPVFRNHCPELPPDYLKGPEWPPFFGLFPTPLFLPPPQWPPFPPPLPRTPTCRPL